MTRTTASLRPFVILGLLVAAGGTMADDDWSRFRGPTQTGSAATGATADWPESPVLEVVWTTELGPGYSGIASRGDRVFTCWAEGDSEWVGAFAAADGRPLWRLGLGPRYEGHDGSHDGPIASPTVGEADGRELVFAVGAHGRLVAASADGGEPLWSVELTEMGKPPYYGVAASPLFVESGDESVLITQVAFAEGPTAAGFDPLTGEVRWTAGDDGAAYQSPVLVELGGKRQVVVAGVSTLYGIEPLSGEVLWSHGYGGEPRAMGSVSTVPLPLGNDILLVKPEASASAALAVTGTGDGWTVDERWTSRDLSRSYVPATSRSGRVFGYKGRFLVAVDAADGSTLWRSRPPGDGFLAIADDVLIVVTKKGSLHLASASADEWRELASLDVFDADTDSTVWTEPTVADGDIFVRSMGALARVTVRPAEESGADQLRATAGTGLDVPPGEMADLLDRIESSDDPSGIVDELLETRSAAGEIPVIEGDRAIFLFRSSEDSVGIEGDMLGGRVQGRMRRAGGSDLFYFVDRLPRDTWISYRFVPGFGDPVVDPLTERQTMVDGENGPEAFSWFAMPDWQPAVHSVEEPPQRGRIVHHDVPVPAAEAPAEEAGDEAAGEADDGMPAITSRGIDVWLPPGFDPERTEPYPVVFVPQAQMVRGPLALDAALDVHLGSTLPEAIVVLVGPHDPRPGFDLFAGGEAATGSFLEQVVPFVLESYPVATEGPLHAVLGFTMSATRAASVGFDPRSRAGRVVLIQPFFLDAMRLAVQDLASRRSAPLAEVYLESSPLGLRGEDEGWDAEEQVARLATFLEKQGYAATTGTSNLPFVLRGLRGRVADALAFAVTGRPEAAAPEK